MNRDDIIRMAREACDQAPREDWNSTAWVFGDESLEQFAAFVAVAERQRQQLTDEDISVLWHQSGEQPFKFARMLLK